MSIYTRTGDRGETDLVGGVRAPKDAARLEVCGDLDELNSWLGLVRCEHLPDNVAALLERIQRRLFDVGAELITVAVGETIIDPSDVQMLEQAIDRCEAKLEPLDTFILPGGSRTSAMLHLARAVCRRVERRLVAFTRTEHEAASDDVLAYVNRLSDLLFVLARTANGHADIVDIPC